MGEIEESPNSHDLHATQETQHCDKCTRKPTGFLVGLQKPTRPLECAVGVCSEQIAGTRPRPVCGTAPSRGPLRLPAEDDAMFVT